MFYHEIYHTVRVLIDDAADWVWGEKPGVANPPVLAWRLEGAAGSALLRDRDVRLPRRTRVGAQFTDEDIALALNTSLSALIRVLWNMGEIEHLSQLRQEIALTIEPTVNQYGENILYCHAVLPPNFMLPLNIAVRQGSTRTNIAHLEPNSPWGGMELLYLLQSGNVAALGVPAPFMIETPSPQGGPIVVAILANTADVTVSLHYLREPVWFRGTADLLNWNVLPMLHPDGFSQNFYQAIIHGAALLLRIVDTGTVFPEWSEIMRRMLEILREEYVESTYEGTRQ